MTPTIAAGPPEFATYALALDGSAWDVSPRLERMLGYAEMGLKAGASSFAELIHPDDRERVARESADPSVDDLRMEYRLCRVDGSHISVLDQAAFVSNEAGDRVARHGVVVDITDGVRTNEALRMSEARFRTLLLNIPGAMYRCAAKSDWDMEFISDNIESLSGYPASDFINSSVRTFASIIHSEDRQSVEDAVDAALGRGEPFILEYRIVRADGGIAWVYEKGQGVFGADGEVLWLDGAIFDITERKLLQQELAHQAFYDSLTGLANRALLHDRTSHAVAQAERRGDRLAMLLLDLDGFKIINDSLGHQTGDEVLMMVAKRIMACCRVSDTVARLGGDEFAVLLEEDVGELSAGAVAERLLETLRQPFMIQGRELSVGASIGIAFSDGAGSCTGDLLRDADAAMYGAKNRGRDRYELFEPSMHTKAVELFELNADLQTGLDQEQFVVHYQPILDLAAGTVNGVEALVRWQHPSRGMLAPAEFIPVAEQTGLIVPLGYWVLRTACLQMRAWRDEFPAHEPFLSVNLSPRQLYAPELVSAVRSVLEETGLDPATLVLEITEGALLQGMEETRQTLTELKALGVKLAIDDFGAGSSSLGYLSEFPVDILKIDRSFIRGMSDDAGDGHVVVRAILDLARALHLETVAEGIELPEQLSALLDSGCASGQGFFFAKPVSADRIGELLTGAGRSAAEVLG
jgi:diguanylate cyclase (GGDEF)-like protein/PAS domain S-box-containing protein